MSDENQNPAGEHQDPAEQYQVDTAVETEPQPGADEDGFGGDAPEPAEPVEVSADETETPTIILAGENYTVDQDKGYRKQPEAEH